jgi:antitoxin (DNA-binding transcriptional repressor) of toxin-antitoxin stability system
MKTATVRDLRYDFPKLEAWLEGGEEILITKHSKPVARLCAPLPAGAGPIPAAHPDYEARLQRIWGDRIFTRTEIDEMRAFETGEP